MANWAALGIAPWQVHDFGPQMVKGMTFRGQAQTEAVQLSLCDIGPLSFELIGPGMAASIYREHLDHHGEGLHHVGYFVDHMEAAIADMIGRGYLVLRRGHGFGRDDDGAYAYFNTEAAIGCVIEAMLAPKRLPPPARWFPAEGE